MKRKITLNSNMTCIQRMEKAYQDASATSKKICEYVKEHKNEVVYMTVSQLAESCGVSDASVVRFSQVLNYSGYNEFKINLASEIELGGQVIFEDVSTSDNESEILNKVFSSELQALQQTMSNLDKTAFSNAVNNIAFANRIEFYACGNANPIIEDAHYRFMRIGLDSRIGIDDYDALIHASKLTKGDVAIAVSHSGSTKNTIQMLEIAKKSGATTICITGFLKTKISEIADICLISSSKETMFRNVAMASRIAQMAIMDALVVAVAFKRYDKSKIAINETDKILADEKL